MTSTPLETTSAAPVRVVRVTHGPLPTGQAVHTIRRIQSAAVTTTQPPTTAEAGRPVGQSELALRLNEERGMWSSCVDEKIGHLAALVAALEQRVETGLARIGAGEPCSRAEGDKEVTTEFGAQRLCSELSMPSELQETTSCASTGLQDSKSGPLLNLMSAVEMLQVQSSKYRGEIEALKAEMAEQKVASYDTANSLDSLQQDIQLIFEQKQDVINIDELRCEIVQGVPLQSQATETTQAVGSVATVADNLGTSQALEALEREMEALRKQMDAVGAQQSMLRAHTSAAQQKVMNDIGVTKAQLSQNIAALQNQVEGVVSRVLRDGNNELQCKVPRSHSSTTAGSDAEEAHPKAEKPQELQVGCTVLVTEDFASNSKSSVLLREGWHGHINRFDEDGDALLEFPDHQLKEWVHKRNFPKLKRTETEESDDSDSEDGEATSMHRGSVTEGTDLENDSICSCKLF